MSEMDSGGFEDDIDYSEVTTECKEGKKSFNNSESCRSPKVNGGGTAADMTAVVYEAVYVRDNVSVHPTQSSSERITGRLRLIKQGPSLFMTWIPYNEGPLAEGNGKYGSAYGSKSSGKDRNLYTIRAVSVAEMRSIRRSAPALGCPYIIVVLISGLAFPPLYFHNGGVQEFLGTLKEYALLVRSAEDANVFLVNDFQDPLQKSLTELDLIDVTLPPALPLTIDSPCELSEAPSPTVPLQEISNLKSNKESLGSLLLEDQSENQQMERALTVPDNTPREQSEGGRELSLRILEKFSFVTKIAREATSHFLTQGEGLLLGTLDPLEPPSSPASRVNTVENSENHLHLRQSKSMVLPLGAVVAASQAGQVWVGGRRVSLDKALIPKRDDEASTGVGSFELVDGVQQESPALVWARARPPPLGFEEWATFLDKEGRVVDPKSLKRRVFHGGCEPSLRIEVWKILLGYQSFSSTRVEREAVALQKAEEYETLKAQWQTVSNEQAKRFGKYRERRSRVDKDVVRTDRMHPFYAEDDNPNVDLLRSILVTYSFYNFDLGYCQGMSDLLSPILYIMKDEAEAFWCFSALMERMASNFHLDQNGMHSQLLSLRKLVQLLDPPLYDYLRSRDCLNFFFCFRWILIHFKREFAYDNVLRLWEVLWTRHLSDYFHLYICVAVLKRHRRRIIDEQMEFDTLLKFINELSGHIELESTLRDAEALCVHAGERGIACLPPTTPVSPLSRPPISPAI